MTELHDQLCKIGFPCGDAGCFQRLVEPDLLRGHGFDLDDLVNGLAANKINDDSVGLVGVASPMHHAASGDHGRFQLRKVIRQVRHRVNLELTARFAQLLPIRELGDDLSPFGADRGRRLAEVAPQLRVSEGAPCGDRELLLAAQVANSASGAGGGMAGNPSITGVFTAPGPRRVAARICARWSVFAPARIRDSPPPMCIRQELSPAVQISAPVSKTLRILSASMAVDVSAFLIANVPPKPQH